MSSCIKDLYDYDLVKICCGCKIILLKSNFHKDNKRKYGLQRICVICIKHYHINRKDRRNALEKQKRETDFSFILICNKKYELTKLSNVKKLKKLKK